MKKKQSFLLLFLFSFSLLSTYAKGNNEVDRSESKGQKNVFDLFDPTNARSSVSFFQDKRIEQFFLDRQESNSVQIMRGFRVQIFSSNKPRKAKEDAYKIEKNIEQKFPNENIYVSYSSPFWKVRVGDFRTEEAAKVMEFKLKKALPDIKHEIYVVRDEIRISQYK